MYDALYARQSVEKVDNHLTLLVGMMQEEVASLPPAHV